MRAGLPIALLLVAASPPPRTLDPQGLGPVRIGMTVAAAEHALGARLRVDASPVADGECSSAVRRDGRDKQITYMVEGGRITRIDIDTAQVRTAKGVGLGSTIAQVRKAYGATFRSHPNPYTELPDLEVRTPGSRFGLIFETDHGRVITMRSGKYPSVAYSEHCS